MTDSPNPAPRAKKLAAPRKPKKPEFSPTRIKTFLSCPMMYRLEYVDKVGRFYHRSRAGFSFGTSLHSTLQNFHEAGGSAAVTSEELVTRLDQDWIPQGYASPEQEQEHRVEAAQILTTYHALASERADLTRTFLTEKMLKYDMGEFVLTGRIDRIDEHVADGALEIVDYKSGRMSVTEDDVKSALAMSIYQLLAKRCNPDRRVFATIHALRGGVTASCAYSDDELDALEDDLRGIGLMILEKDFESVRPEPLPDVCPWCDFLPACTRYWRSQRRDYLNELRLIEG